MDGFIVLEIPWFDLDAVDLVRNHLLELILVTEIMRSYSLQLHYRSYLYSRHPPQWLLCVDRFGLRRFQSPPPKSNCSY
jgi:hypothetical protein